MKKIIDFMKNILFKIYYITLMPYFQRDKYFEIMCDEADEIIQRNL